MNMYGLATTQPDLPTDCAKEMHYEHIKWPSTFNNTVTILNPNTWCLDTATCSPKCTIVPRYYAQPVDLVCPNVFTH